jgi:quinol monooxygenase YgiN
MIYVVATTTLKPGCRAAFLVEFKRMVPETLAEVGCISYAPVVDVGETIHPKQVAERSDVVTVLETWRDLDCLRAHLAAPHMAAYREKVKDLVAAGQLQILTAG